MSAHTHPGAEGPTAPAPMSAHTHPGAGGPTNPGAGDPA